MVFLFRIRFTKAQIAWMFLFGVVCTGSVQSQTLAPSKPRASLPLVFNQPFSARYEKQSLADILHVLMTQCRINVLADGNSARKEANFNFNGTVAQALDSIGEAFDCDWTVNKRGVALLRRRFSSPDELPQMRLAEMQQMASDIFKALRMVPIDTEMTHQFLPMDRLVGSLTPEQQQSLLAGNRLKARSLLPGQQTMLEAALATYTYNPAFSVWEETTAILRAMPGSYITAREESAAFAHPRTVLLHISKEKGSPARSTVLQNVFIHAEKGENP